MPHILALDLGKFKTVACLLDSEQKLKPRFFKVSTDPASLHDLIVEHEPMRVVIEVGGSAGWVVDLCRSLTVEVEVANVNHPAWRWKNNARKTDRDDALRLAKMSLSGELPTVHVPDRVVRQWRSLIEYRQSLVGRRTAIKCSIRSLLMMQARQHPGGRKGWSEKALNELAVAAKPLAECAADELWKGQLHLELQQLQAAESAVDLAEEKLNALAEKNPQVQRLQTMPGVGPRLSEAIVAIIDKPQRFSNGKQVSSYAGLTPRLYESGTMSRQGGISKRGNELLRTLLVEVAWMVQRYNKHFAGVFQRICGESKTRRKIANVAVARRVLVTCWAMMRDQADWKHPAACGGGTMATPAA